MRILMIAFMALGLSGAAASAQQSGDPKKGQGIYVDDGCYQCHGYAGQGATMTGPRLSRTALPFDAFLNQLRQPASEMAPYEKAVLSDADAADIYAYLKAMPAPPDPKTLQLLYPKGQ